MTYRNILIAVLSTLLMAGLTACGSSPPTRLYLVEPVIARASVIQDPQLTILVDEVVLPEYLRRKEILSRTRNYVASAATFDRWAEPLEASVTSTLAQNIAALVGSDRVIPQPSELARSGDFRVSVQVLAFGPAPSGDVELRALWAIFESSGEVVILRRSEVTEATSSAEPSQVVNAMSRSLGHLSDEIASALLAAASTTGE